MTINEKIDFLLSREVRDYLQNNPETDPAVFLLNPPEKLKLHGPWVADQLASRKKAKKKLPEWFQNLGLIYPPPLSLEQCSSPITAEYKARLMNGKQLIDLTGGMGIDCLALSKNFEHATYVEQDEWLCAVFASNTKAFNTKIEIKHTTADQYLSQFEGKASFFIDPARRGAVNQKVFLLEDCTPNLLALLTDLKKKSDQVLIKLSPMLDITVGIKALQPASVHVVAVQNECKELLFLLRPESSSTPEIICSHFTGGSWQTFEMYVAEEQTVLPTYGTIGEYLYDANAAILKAGAFKLVAQRYGLTKLAPNTHLYTSNNRVSDFPGRVFKVLATEMSAKKLKQWVPEGKAHVITRNYPIGAEQLKKQLKLTEGGDLFVMGYRDSRTKAVLSVCKQLTIGIHQDAN